MEGLRHIAKIREYCDYLERHLQDVEKAWEILQLAIAGWHIIVDDFLFFTVDSMIKKHDLSKLSPEEFIQYQRYFYNVDFPAPKGLDAAWDNHLAANPHHWQSWPSSTEHFPNEHTCHCVCMVVDWMAMGVEMSDTAEKYYENNKEKINLPDWAIEFIQGIFARLALVETERGGMNNDRRGEGY